MKFKTKDKTYEIEVLEDEKLIRVKINKKDYFFYLGAQGKLVLQNISQKKQSDYSKVSF